MSALQMEALDFRYLLLEYYHKLNIKEDELAVILMIDHLIDQKNTLVTPDLLSLKMSLSSKEIDRIYVGLVEKGYLVFSSGKNMKVSLKPLYKKLYEVFQISMAKEQENQNSEAKASYFNNLYVSFEKELGRTLSPLEMSVITDWVEQGYSDETIINALKESLSKGKKSLKSVDKILLQWQARDDIEKTGYTAISKEWNKDIEKSMKIAKAKWTND